MYNLDDVTDNDVEAVEEERENKEKFLSIYNHTKVYIAACWNRLETKNWTPEELSICGGAPKTIKELILEIERLQNRLIENKISLFDKIEYTVKLTCIYKKINDSETLFVKCLNAEDAEFVAKNLNESL